MLEVTVDLTDLYSRKSRLDENPGVRPEDSRNILSLSTLAVRHKKKEVKKKEKQRWCLL